MNKTSAILQLSTSVMGRRNSSSPTNAKPFSLPAIFLHGWRILKLQSELVGEDTLLVELRQLLTIQTRVLTEQVQVFVLL